MTLAHAPYGGVTRHLPNGFKLMRDKKCLCAQTRRRSSCLAARMTAADHNNVVFFLNHAHAPFLYKPKPLGKMFHVKQSKPNKRTVYFPMQKSRKTISKRLSTSTAPVMRPISRIPILKSSATSSSSIPDSARSRPRPSAALAA